MCLWFWFSVLTSQGTRYGRYITMPPLPFPMDQNGDSVFQWLVEGDLERWSWKFGIFLFWKRKEIVLGLRWWTSLRWSSHLCQISSQMISVLNANPKMRPRKYLNGLQLSNGGGDKSVWASAMISFLCDRQWCAPPLLTARRRTEVIAVFFRLKITCM